MLLFNKREETPPDGFRYVHPETGFTSTAIDIYNWMLGINQHRRANNLPEITEAQASDQACRTLPPGWCHRSEDEEAAHGGINTRLTFADIAEGTKAYVALIAGGFQTVPQEEANRRAKICAGCYLGVQPQGCGACLKIQSLITGDIARKTTPHDDYLVNKACAVCHCGLRSVVHFPMAALDKADSAEKQAAYTPFCWRKHGGENYRPE